MKMMFLGLLLAVGVSAQARPGDIFGAPSLTTLGPAVSTFYTTFCADNPTCGNKLIVDAREDAAAFIGSNGAIRGAQLEQALLHIRQANPELRASDMDLANKIVDETN